MEEDEIERRDGPKGSSSNANVKKEGREGRGGGGERESAEMMLYIVSFFV